MSNSLAVVISPNYKDYAEKYLADCLASLSVQTFQEFDLFLIDNETSEESFNFLKALAPQAHIIRSKKNEGFAGGNNLALQEIIVGGYEFVCLLNMDTVSKSDCLEKMIEAGKKNSQAGAIQARLMLYPQTDTVNSLGNETHFLGFGYCRGYQEKFNEKNCDLQEIAYASGAAVLLRVEALKKVGIFDEEMWMYNEDQDLGWRLWLGGYTSLFTPEAVVYHAYEFSRSIKKFYWMDRNRILTIIKNYHWLTLVLIFPAFVIMEIGLLLFSIQSGWFKEKMQVWQYFLSGKN